MRRLLLFCFSIASTAGMAQVYPFVEKQYDFIQYDINEINFYGKSKGYDAFYSKMDSLFF